MATSSCAARAHGRVRRGADGGLPTIGGVLRCDAHGDRVPVDAVEGVGGGRVDRVDEELGDGHGGRQLLQVATHGDDELQRGDVGAGDALRDGVLHLQPRVKGEHGILFLGVGGGGGPGHRKKKTFLKL